MSDRVKRRRRAADVTSAVTGSIRRNHPDPGPIPNGPAAAIPPGALTFNLSSLGWKAFQDLCGSILRQVLGQTVVGFSAGRDMGRDWAFQGSWRRQANESAHGQMVIQCKFHEGGGLLPRGEVDAELPKIASLHELGICDTYVLMTNLRSSSRTVAEIVRAVREVGPTSILVIGGQQIDTYLREEPRLRALVPRV